MSMATHLGVDAPGRRSRYSRGHIDGRPDPGSDPMATTTSPSAPPDAAHILRAARERRGESIEEASEATRISTEYLDALERDAPLSAFPAPVYARFFLRQYARHLQLDEDAVV